MTLTSSCGTCGATWPGEDPFCPGCAGIHPEHLASGGSLPDGPTSTSATSRQTLALHAGPATRPEPVDWHALFARDASDRDWIVDGFLPRGRHAHIHAPRKNKKSLLSLWVSGNLSAGRHPFTGVAQDPVPTLYMDYEMTEDDLLERVEEMGFTPDELAHLTYYLHPVIAPLDTAQGGVELAELVDVHRSEVVVLDTVSRIIDGEENSADTFRALFRHTGTPLKQRNVSLIRLDHEGHEGGRSRGSSAKGDDVDIVWGLTRTDTGLTLKRKASRISWVPETINLRQTNPLGYRIIDHAWPAGTAETATLLDQLGVPLDASRRTAAAAIKAASTDGKGARNEVISAAQRWRRHNHGIDPTAP